jgi:hypothetical protein
MSTLKTLQSKIKQIEGKGANSASPSDIWFAKTSKKELVFKISLNSNTTGYNFKNGSKLEFGEEEEAVEYEAKLYVEIINEIIEKNINPFFVKCEEAFFSVPFKEIIEFHKVFGMRKCTFRNKLLRNTLYMSLIPYDSYKGIFNRPSIDKVSTFHTPIQTSQLLKNEDNIKALIQAYSIMHNIEEFDTILKPDELYYNVLVTSKTTDISLSNLHNHGKLTKNGKLNKMGWTVIIQILTALSTLEILKVAHNDLHMGNILIENTTENTKYFQFDNFAFGLTSNFNCKIYDWDRAYSENLGDNNLLNSVCVYSQCNEYIPQREVAKIFIYFIISRQLDSDERNLLYRFLIPDKTRGIQFISYCGNMNDFLICSKTNKSFKREEYEKYGFQKPTDILVNILNYIANKPSLDGIVNRIDKKIPSEYMHNITTLNVKSIIENKMEF